jgi:hypothetical protein
VLDPGGVAGRPRRDGGGTGIGDRLGRLPFVRSVSPDYLDQVRDEVVPSLKLTSISDHAACVRLRRVTRSLYARTRARMMSMATATRTSSTIVCGASVAR